MDQDFRPLLLLHHGGTVGAVSGIATACGRTGSTRAFRWP